MNDSYTVEMRLCDDAGMVSHELREGHKTGAIIQSYLDFLNNLRFMTGVERYEGKPFHCTGSAHLAGEHIRCTSPAHEMKEIRDMRINYTNYTNYTWTTGGNAFVITLSSIDGIGWIRLRGDTVRLVKKG